MGISIGKCVYSLEPILTDSIVKTMQWTPFLVTCIPLRSNVLNKKILRKINDNETEICALAERSFLKTLGGDCDTAVGCFAIFKENKIEVTAQLLSDDGKKVFIVTRSGKIEEPQLLGKLVGEEILKKSGNNFLKKKWI